MAQLEGVPLILPTGAHGLRSTLDAAFARAGIKPQLVAEVDSLTMLMDAVCAGLGCTVQPWAALGRVQDAALRLQWSEIADAQVRRSNAAVQPVGRRAVARRAGHAGGAGRLRAHPGALGRMGRAHG